MSNEDLQKVYERSRKNLRSMKSLDFENLHRGTEVYLYQKFIFLGAITSMAVTSDNRFLISGSEDKSIKVFDLPTKQLVHHFENAHKSKEFY